MKRRLKKNPKRREAVSRSPADKVDLIAGFRARVSVDEKVQFLADNNISRSSIFRWQRELASLEQATLSDPKRAVVDAIRLLCDQDDHPRSRLVDAIAVFSAWLRWPSSPKERQVGTAVLHASYLKHQLGDKPLAEFAHDDIDGLLRSISASQVANLLAGESDNHVDFTEYLLAEHRYAERHLLRDVVAFLISADEPKPSLNKAFYLIEGGAIGHRILRSRRTFDALWQRMATAAPFYFVEQDDSGLNWYLDPFDGEYATYVDEIIDHPSERRAYFSKCAWVIRRLRERQSDRSQAATTFPIISGQVGEIPAVCPTLSQDVRERLAIYSRTLRPVRQLRRPRT